MKHMLRDVVTLALATVTLVIVKTLQSVIEAYEDDDTDEWPEVWAQLVYVPSDWEDDWDARHLN